MAKKLCLKMFSPHVMAAMFGFPTAPKKKSPAPKKKKAENWFEKLKNDQLKELLRATQQTMSGTKDELVARLCSHPQMAEYAHEFRWPTPRGVLSISELTSSVRRAAIYSTRTHEMVGGRAGG